MPQGASPGLLCPLPGVRCSMGPGIIPLPSMLMAFARSSRALWLFPDGLIQSLPLPGKKKG